MSKLNGIIGKVFLAGIVLLASANAEEYKPLFGLAHGPFREGQSPETGVFPTEAQVREDISLNERLAKAERTFGCDNILFNIPQYCNDAGIDCYVGSWFNKGDSSGDQQTINLLLQIADENYPTTKALIVGNEFLLGNFEGESRLINLINQVNNATNVPVTTAETYNTWIDHPNLVNAVDFIGIHIYPYWEGISIDGAAQFVVDKYNLIKQTFPGKEVVIFETGWPTEGSAHYSAVPSEENQKKFLEDFIPLAEQNNIKYFIFEGFDEPWKAKYSDVEDHWGVFYENRTLKPQLESVLNTNPADLNDDGGVDYEDLFVIASDWLNPYNLIDYAVFANNFKWQKIQ
jgi:exo-beta-1,3-glucanase (GH17 family)